jgi:hypothetical protein
MAVPLAERVVLAEEQDRPAAHPVNPDLRARTQTVPEAEPDERARVQAEEVLDEAAEVSLPEGPREPVRDAEVPLPVRHAQRGRQRREVEVGLQQVDAAVLVDVAGCAAAVGRPSAVCAPSDGGVRGAETAAAGSTVPRARARRAVGREPLRLGGSRRQADGTGQQAAIDPDSRTPCF